MSIHNLKILRKPFEDLVSGRKTGEVRNCADREFHEGDQVELFLIDETGNPANKSIVRTITHIQRGFGLPDDICVLSYAAPVVERQPVSLPPKKYPRDWNKKALSMANMEYMDAYNDAIDDVAKLGPLYTSPVADDLVRLLTRARIYARGEFRDEIDACLEKVKELNQ